MKNPFPGMNPYLEGSVYHDLHVNLITQIQRALQPQIRPKYVARAERYTVQNNDPKNDLGIVYPDIEIVERDSRVKEPTATYGTLTYAATIDPPTVSIPFTPPETIELTRLKIMDVDQRSLVTVIEILSPVNKRKAGLETYLKKRDELIAGGINVLEIDLLRRGTRTVKTPDTTTDYLIALTRQHPPQRDIWAIDLRSPLPSLPVPLLPTDTDAVINLQALLNDIYEALDYGFDLDYSAAPPPPKLLEPQQRWVREQIRNANIK